ncbi:MAG: hypothetical protein ACLP9L_41045 [Thermoguttaceae bacterium]
MKCLRVWIIGVVLLAGAIDRVGAEDKPVARPLPNHPGNVFLAGEEVSIVLSAEDGATWHVADYDGKPAASGTVQGGKARLGRLALGYYELRCGAAATTIGVLAPRQSPVPQSSPIAIDVAMSWFYQTAAEKAAAASLCKLAGTAWVRDRMMWDEIEPGREQFARTTRYDQSARIQSESGLHVLQVLHRTAAWAGRSSKHFPEDLRDIYSFLRHTAARWKGRVQAFEPWNEADIDMFGGHTGAEMASLQKAAYLGLKAGNPEAVACLNVFAIDRRDTLDDLAANSAWPYFDTCNLHHYIQLDDYPAWYAAFRRISAGRPLWVTEFSQPVQWAGDPKAQEPTAADQRLQACRVPIVFASALHEGPAEAFYFLLPHYSEGKVQFGIVHRDLTPRPAYVALAAVGRLLAEARPLGRWKVSSQQTRAFLFRARPDGEDEEVLVAWTPEAHGELQLPVAPTALFDHLGRSVPPQGRALRLSPAPIYVVLPPGTGQRLTLTAPPTMPPRQEAKPSPVVLQTVWPRERVVLDKSAYRVVAGENTAVSVFAYNFSDAPVAGKLSVVSPNGWDVSITDRMELAAGERKQVAMRVHRPVAKGDSPEIIRLTGDFGQAGEAVLSIRLQVGK